MPHQSDMDMAALPSTALITAPCDLSMRAAIELRQATGHPVALVEDGKLVGVCGDEEIYAGILRQRSEEHTSELQSLMRISYAVFCLNKNTLIHVRHMTDRMKLINLLTNTI